MENLTTVPETSDAGGVPRTFGAEVAAVLRDSRPDILGGLGLGFMAVADALFLGHVSPAALASWVIGYIVATVLVTLGTGLLSPLQHFIPNALRSDDAAQQVPNLFWRGLILAVLLAIPFSLAFLHLEPVLALLGVPAELVSGATAYTHALAWGILPLFVLSLLRFAVESRGASRSVLAALVLGTLAQVVLDWMLIFGHGGYPAQGVAGAGNAASAARWITLVLFVAFTFKPLGTFLGTRARKLWTPMPYVRLLRWGSTRAVHRVLELMFFSIVAVLMGRLGIIQLAAHQIALALASLTFVFAPALTGVARTRVLNALESSDVAGARRTAAACLTLAFASQAFFAVVFALCARPLAGFFGTDPAMLELAAVLLPIVGLFQISDGVQITAIGVLHGKIDLVIPHIVSLGGFWLLGLPVGYYLAFHRGMGPAGLWWAIALAVAPVALFLTVRAMSNMKARPPVAYEVPASPVEEEAGTASVAPAEG
jgi:MATE family multidrug resistance protein